MTEKERTRYIIKLRQTMTKLAQLENSGQTASSVYQGSNHPPASRARVVQVAMPNNYGRLQSGVKAKNVLVWGRHLLCLGSALLGSVKRALVMLSHGRCSCGAKFHMRE